MPGKQYCQQSHFQTKTLLEIGPSSCLGIDVCSYTAKVADLREKMQQVLNQLFQMLLPNIESRDQNLEPCLWTPLNTLATTYQCPGNRPDTLALWLRLSVRVMNAKALFLH